MKLQIQRAITLLLVCTTLLGLAACTPVLAPVEETLAPSRSDDTTTQTPDTAPKDNGGDPVPAATLQPQLFMPLSINEVMLSNKATVADDAGLFPDWLELYNYGSESQSLDGLVLRNGDKTWSMPDRQLAPGEYYLIFCDGSGSDAQHASFTLSKDGVDLRLESAAGELIEQFIVPACDGDESVYREEDGSLTRTRFATPGYENSMDGYVRTQEARSAAGPLQIYEVVVYNQWDFYQRGSYYDWVELKNVSDSPISLHDYYLSDSGSDRAKYRLPDRQLNPDDIVVIHCIGDPSAIGVNTPFALSADSDQLFLSRADGTLVDYAALHDIPYHGSFGRMDGQPGFFYFERSTPAEDNADGARCRADMPRLVGRDGVYNDVNAVSVTLEGSGAIYYTTDGSVPDEDDTLYTGPIELTKTTVIRAVSYADDRLPSDTLELSYIINEGHTLPVVSLVADPDEILGGAGVYRNPNLEKECLGSVKLFENGEGFVIDCGIKLHGATSKFAQDKKSLKLCFRSRYEGELHYDLFGNGVCDYSSILLRSAQESTYSTLMRDNIVHQLAIRCFPELPAQDYKYSVLYINGKYWGVYNIREAHSDEHYAYHYGYDPQTVTQWKEVWDKTSNIGELCSSALNRNLANDENYNAIAARVNVDSVIGWTILQAWCSNHDCNPPNMRYYYSTEDNVLRYALVDLDLGMFEYDLFDVPLKGAIVDGSRYSYPFNKLANKLMENHQYQLRMAEQLAAALRGPMSDENVLALIDEFADALRPEMARDRERWGHGGPGDTEEFWEHGFQMVDYLRDFVSRKDGRSTQLLKSFLSHTNLTSEEKERIFGDLLP
ncbi:MAG: CotH kinase family protein [Oscillospiraceae bacterium]|nr:CotH kinase family protein [Oscillospiraceae bacterium]